MAGARRRSRGAALTRGQKRRSRALGGGIYRARGFSPAKGRLTIGLQVANLPHKTSGTGLFRYNKQHGQTAA